MEGALEGADSDLARLVWFVHPVMMDRMTGQVKGQV